MYELPPPDEETANILRGMSESAGLRPAHPDYVRFYSRSKENKDKTATEGRPIFEAVEYVEILCPGDKDTIVDRPVRKVDRYAWSQKYVAFKNGQEQMTTGTLLTEWKGISPERVAELAPFKVRTVEQLADVPDSILPGLGMHARSEREKARGYLAVMKGSLPVAEMKAENEKLKAEQAAMLERLAALEKLAASSPVEAPKKTK